LQNYDQIKQINTKKKETLSDEDLQYANEMVLDKKLAETLACVVKDYAKRKLAIFFSKKITVKKPQLIAPNAEF